MKYTWNFFRHRSNLARIEYLSKGRVVPPPPGRSGYVKLGGGGVEGGEGPDVISLNIQTLPLCCSSLALLNRVLDMLCLLSFVQSVQSCVNLWLPGILLTCVKPRGLSFGKKGYNICFRFVLSSPNKNSRADLIFDILAAASDAFVLSWDERFYCMLAKVRILVIGRSVATVFAQRSSL
jgi:hypothetical protein